MVIMNKKNFIKIVQQPNNLSEKELKFVEEINKEYPYFQASKAILLKFLKKLGGIVKMILNYSMKIGAI